MDNEKANHKENKSTGIFIGIITILLIACFSESYYIYAKHISSQSLQVNSSVPANNTAMRPINRPKPSFILKGMKFTDSPLFSKAYLIFPVSGDLSSDVQKALTGWDLKTNTQSDGSTLVTLIPHEAEDIQQQYMVKTGYKLYFIEMTLSDDKTGVDENRSDDIGVLVNPDGIVE